MLRPNLQSANIFYSMQKRLLFKIDYVCKIPWGGGEQGHFWPAVYYCAGMGVVFVISPLLCGDGYLISIAYYPFFILSWVNHKVGQKWEFP